MVPRPTTPAVAICTDRSVAYRKLIYAAGVVVNDLRGADRASGTAIDVVAVAQELEERADDVALAVVTTPATVNVPRSKRNIMAVCRKEGLADSTETIPSELHGGTVGNVIAGGTSAGDILTTIVSGGAMHFVFDGSEAVLLKYLREGGANQGDAFAGRVRRSDLYPAIGVGVAIAKYVIVSS